MRGDFACARLLMLINKNSEPENNSLWERLAAFGSKCRLLALLAKRACINAARAVSLRCRSFYYEYLYHKLAPVRGAFASLRRSRLQSISLIVTLVLLLPMASFMRVGVSVTVDGRVLGYVEDKTEVQAACRSLEASSSEVLGEPFSLDADISYAVAVTTQNSFIEPEELPAAIADNVDSLATIAVVKVDGETVGACAEELQAQQVLTDIRDEFAAGDPSAKVRFVENVVVETLAAPTELLRSEEDLKNTLLETTMQAQIYKVTETDTMTSIAQEHGMLLDDLLALNPEVVPERMAPGSEVTIRAAAPLLSVEVVKTVEYTEEVPFETISTENPALARGKTEVMQAGVAGLAAVSAEVTERNGEEQSRTVLSRTVTRPPVDALVSVGTKNLGIGTGALISPVENGTVTSGYKYRWGRLHKGLDYGTPTGTPIRAADNGRVIVSEFSRSGYGYYVIIDHGNGMKTLYGHNSQLLLNVGDTVEQGQTIAYSGNTGNSTGPHCHFEVLVNDENIDPANYV